MDNKPPHSWRPLKLVAAALSLTLLTATVLFGCMDRSTSPERDTQTMAVLDSACTVLKSSDSSTISVLGDSTSNDSNEWVALWAQRLGEDHVVTMPRWNDSTERWDRPPLTYGTSGPAIKIWNFSAPGRTPSYASMRVVQAVPAQPDLIVFNFGHNNVPGEITSQYSSLLSAVRNRWPLRAHEVIVLQNPELGNRESSQALVRAEIRMFAVNADVPVIDVSATFAASADAASLMADDVHPSAEGHQLWAQTVSSRLCMT